MATAPETAPAVASILTGLYQHHHQVPHNMGVLPEDITTLAEYLRAAGYTTAGFQGNLLLVKYFGFSQGFDRFESFASPWSLISSDDRGATLAIDWLRTAPEEPWFLWIHFMDPHGPYRSAHQWWSEDFEYPHDLVSDDKPVPLADTNFGLGIIPRYQRIKEFANLSYYVRRYDGEIRFTDAQVGNVLAALSLFGYRDNTVVVFTADHGESLTEHREYLQHGWYLYDTTLHVPMIFSWPGRLQHRGVDVQVSGVDLVPSVLHLVGIDARGAQLDGESFAPVLIGGEAAKELPAFAVGPRRNQPFAVSQGGWKLIHSPAGKPDKPNAEPRDEGYNTPERLELYRIADDPGEMKNIVARHQQVSAKLLGELRDFEKIFEDWLATRPTPHAPADHLGQIIEEGKRSLD